MTTPTHSPEPSARYNDYRIVESVTGAVLRSKTFRSDQDDKPARKWFHCHVADALPNAALRLERHTFKSGEGYKWIPISPLPIFNGDFARWEPDCKESVQKLANDIGTELARLREQNARLIDEAGKRQDDCALMTGQIQFLREQNQQLREALESTTEQLGLALSYWHRGREGRLNADGELAWWHAALKKARAALAEGGKE